jgi:hypothetical protein
MRTREEFRVLSLPYPNVVETCAQSALHFIHYNFARIHKALRITPAMADGISDHIWSYEEIA